MTIDQRVEHLEHRVAELQKIINALLCGGPVLGGTEADLAAVESWRQLRSESWLKARGLESGE